MSISAVDRSLTTALNQIYGASGTGGTSQASVLGTSSTEDSVSLSPQAMQLSSLFGTQSGAAVTLNDLMKFADEKLKEFQKQFKELLEANGIDTSKPISLAQESGSGRLKVTNNHPDAAKIEKLLAENPDLCNGYTAATSALEVAKYGQDQSRFAEAYESNPLAATAQFSYLFNGQYDARVTFNETGYDVSYVQVPRKPSSID
jgi:hypothetical protein